MIKLLFLRVREKLNETKRHYKHQHKVKKQNWFLLILVLVLVAVLVIIANENANFARSDARTQQTLESLSRQLKSIQDEQIKLKQDVKGVSDKVSLRNQKRSEAAQLASVQPARSLPVSVNYSGGVEVWRPLVAKYFPANQVNNALLVMSYESGGNPNSNNATDNHGSCLGSRGLFQIGCDSTANFGAMFNPEDNIAQAALLFNSRYWYPWSGARKAGLI